MDSELYLLRGILSATYERILDALATGDSDTKQHRLEQALWESCGRDDETVRALYGALHWQRGVDPKAGTQFASHDPLAGMAQEAT